MNDAIGKIATVECKDPKEFLHYLRIGENPIWLRDNEYKSSWIFRGQKDESDWTLHPKIWRKSEARLFGLMEKSWLHRAKTRPENLDYFDKYIESLGITLDHRDRFLTILQYTLVEVDSIYQFIQDTDELAYRLLNQRDFGRWDDVIRRHNYLLREGLYEQTGTRFPVWDGRNHTAVALAQHHGIPTALLDWTRNPLIAAFFAANMVNIEDKVNRENDEFSQIAVWALRSDVLGEGFYAADHRLKAVTIPRSENNYLHAQNSLFTYDAGGEEDYLKNGKWPSIQDALMDHQYADIERPLLMKVTFPANQAENLLRLLAAEGISWAHLMPTYDNIAKALKAKWEREDGK